MKKRFLIRQFQKHMLVTVVFIAALSVASVIGIINIRKTILPSDTQLFIDVTSNYADGKSSTETYCMDMEETDAGQQFKKENEIKNKEGESVEDVDTNVVVLSGKDGETPQLVCINSGDKEGVIMIDPSTIQTGTVLSVSRIQNGFSKLSGKDQNLYTSLGYLMYILPVTFSLLGVILSCYIFYRRQIKKPVMELEEATEKIAGRNLDFTISSECKNELGRLCDSFEEMRKALVENNAEMIEMLEERRHLQSSVAHDLRNPIAIMKGYLEMMDAEVEEGVSLKEFKDEIKTLCSTTDRMEEYVKSVSVINKLGDMELELKEENIGSCLKQWEQELKVLAQESDVKVEFSLENEESFTDVTGMIDVSAVSRVLENVISNGCRYAKSTIWVNVSVTEEGMLSFTILDDGPGYPEKLLKNPDLYFYTTDYKHGHMGMGMTVCRIICKKHQGSMKISNQKNGGAKTAIEIKIFRS